MWDQLNLFSESQPHTFTVSEITARIRALLEREAVMRDLWVEGEVSNFSRASSGHIYLTLKDAGAQLGGVIWRSEAHHLRYLPKSGDQVAVHGRIGLYEQGGRYQIYIDEVRPAGMGALYQEYERLKALLEAEGLFATERKRPLPGFPRCIGVVTSPTAAALRDVLKVLTRRFPLVRVLLSPTLVQGDSAPPRIVAALDALNARDDVDVILLVRGGGSLEDLWAFNDERVARAVAASRLPVISGIGHETDFSLADFVADRRAPTPSAAAEIVAPDVGELKAGLWQQQARLERALREQLDDCHAGLERLERELRHLSPEANIANLRQRVDELAQRLQVLVAHRLQVQRHIMEGLAGRLKALNPDAVVARGYALVRDRASGDLVTAAAQTAAGQPLTLHFRDGEVDVNVDDRR